MKKISKHHVGVDPEVRAYVMKRDGGRCVLCGDDRAEYLHLHHIKTRHNKSLINEPSNCVMLCWKHHQEVHQNMKHWEGILQDIADENERRTHGREKNVC